MDPTPAQKRALGISGVSKAVKVLQVAERHYALGNSRQSLASLKDAQKILRWSRVLIESGLKEGA